MNVLFSLKMNRKCLYVTLVLMWCIDFSKNASLSNVDLKKYKHLIEGQGLYTPEDDVNILTVHNIKSHIFGKKYATIVEFYNSWCGFCQRFAPSWKALGTDIKTWKDMVNIAAFDCYDDDNAPVCRDFEIMAYPTLRYFSEEYPEGSGNIGVEIKKGDDVFSHKKYLIKHIINEQRNGRAMQFPNILPYTYTTFNNLYEDVPLGTKFVFFVIEKEDTILGPEIAFDLKVVPNIVVKYAFSNNTVLINNAKVEEFPALFVVNEYKNSQLISGHHNTRESILTAIKDYLRPNDIGIPELTTKKNIFTGKWVDVEVPNMSVLMEAREKENLKQKIKKMGDVVFQADLETALRYSLKHEVALVKTISGDKLEALINYLKILAKYFPFGPKGTSFLVNLRDKVISSGDAVQGSEISRIVSEAENVNALVFSSPPQWLACSGSTSSHRGYPCGLWKLFHFLTVNAVEQNVNKENANSHEVLDGMLAYIKHFFGCSDCSRHFQEMAEQKDLKSVSSLDSAVLWLWMAHNLVNKRLSGDATEDPEFPKVQFPIPERCQNCRNSDTTWNLPEVLQYLKHVYSSINVRYIGSDTRILHLGLEGSAVGNGSSNAVFQNVDTSMCFILYVASFILIIILIRIFLKRGYKKKKYSHDLLGKV